MNSIRLLTVATLLTLVLTSNATAATREEKRVADAADVIEQLLRIPEKTIPPTLLARAYAVAVVPGVKKAAFGFGLRRGKGILVVRQDDNSWSNPAFITLTGGSFGWQVGAQSTDVILVFKTRKGVDGIASGKLTLGADASVAAGPVGRQTAAATDIVLESEVYSYSRNRGLFAGVSIDGSGLTMDRKANAAFYSSASMTPEKIFASSPNMAPDIANTFVQILTAQTRRLPTSRGMDVTEAEPPAEEDASEVRTFGIPDPAEAEPVDGAYDPNY